MLESIRVQNFRSCEDVELRLGESIVALVGKNGAGKTNLLHAIQIVAQLCLGSPDTEFTPRPRDPSRPTAFTLDFSFDEHKYRYVTARQSSTEHSKLEESLTRDGTLLFAREGDRLRALYPPFDSGATVPASLGSLFLLLQFSSTNEDLGKQLQPLVEYLRGIRYYPLTQQFNEHSSRAAPRFVDAARHAKWRGEFPAGGNADSVPHRLVEMHLKSDPSLDELKRILGDDGLGLIADIRIQDFAVPMPRRSDPDALEKAYAISFVPCDSIAGAGRPFSLTGLSAGTWRIVRFLTYLLFDRSTCMLVEQPEDSIHAGLLSKLIDILRTYSDRTQFVCTTHSPRVTNLVGATGIRIVTADSGRTAVMELSPQDVEASQAYVAEEGTLAEFLEML
ncbi:MAG: AAA family ATPase [Phycisphaerae bacterium]